MNSQENWTLKLWFKPIPQQDWKKQIQAAELRWMYHLVQQDLHGFQQDEHKEFEPSSDAALVTIDTVVVPPGRSTPIDASDNRCDHPRLSSCFIPPWRHKLLRLRGEVEASNRLEFDIWTNNNQFLILEGKLLSRSGV